MESLRCVRNRQSNQRHAINRAGFPLLIAKSQDTPAQRSGVIELFPIGVSVVASAVCYPLPAVKLDSHPAIGPGVVESPASGVRKLVLCNGGRQAGE